MKYSLKLTMLTLMALTLTPISGDDAIAASTSATVAAAPAIKPKENVTPEKDYDDWSENDLQCYQCVGCSKVSKSDLKSCSIKPIKIPPVIPPYYNGRYPLPDKYNNPHCVKLVVPGENGGVISRFCDYKPKEHGKESCKISILGPLVYNTCYCSGTSFPNKRSDGNNDGCNGSQRLNQSASLALATIVSFFILK